MMDNATFNISTVNTKLHAGSQWRYDVSVVYPAGVTGSWAAGLTDQTANTLIDNLTNTTDIVQTVVYTFIPHIKPGDAGAECRNGVPYVVNVSLDPQPKIAVTTDNLLCYDGDATFNISTVNSSLHAGSQWRYDVSSNLSGRSNGKLGSRSDRPDFRYAYGRFNKYNQFSSDGNLYFHAAYQTGRRRVGMRQRNTRHSQGRSRSAAEDYCDNR